MTMKMKGKVQYEQSWQVFISKEGEPLIQFVGTWSPAVLERMYYRSVKELRKMKVRAAQERARELESEQPMKEEESDAGRT